MSDELKNPIVTKVMSNGYPPDMYRLEYESPVDGVKDAALIHPPTNGKRDWMVVIHGHGSHETQLCMRQDVRRVQLTAYLELGVGIITPNLRNNAWMGPSAVLDTDALLDFLRSRYGAERFYFESGSMGATSNIIYACLRPQNVSGVVARGAITDLAAYIPFCRKEHTKVPVGDWRQQIFKEIADCIEEAYGGTPEERTEIYRAHSPLFHPEALADIPIFLAHGTQDELMPVAQSRRFAAAMADNPNFTYVEVPGGNHDAPLSIPCLEDSGKICAPLKWIFR